jgi:hypothetical protein
LDQLHTEFTALESEVLTAADLQGSDEESVDVVEPAPPATPRQKIIWNGVELEFVETPEIPLRVFGDLIERWRKDGRGGRWTVGNLEWAAREPGRGNHPWLMKFRGSDHVYRVAYGGHGKREIGYVTRHPAPDFDPDRGKEAHS